MSTVSLIIPAAGSGSRLNCPTPKPFIEIEGRMILEHTLRRFLEVEGLVRIVVATSGSYIETVEKLLASLGRPGIAGKVVKGGAERQHSIRNALAHVEDSCDLVIVHDAVRPFIQRVQIEECCRVAEKNGGAVLGVRAKDTIKRVNDRLEVEETPDRTYLWQAQTPQVFRTGILKEAYRKAIDNDFVGTDDASLVERLGYTVRMVEGDRTNIKITYPRDLKIAKLLVEENADNGN